MIEFDEIDPTVPAALRAEYSRRNLVHAKSVGALAGAEASLARVLAWKKPPAWLVASLEGVVERARPVADEVAKHRDEITIYRKEQRRA